ncbi:TetR/AcrR family transcriptional regulator [Paenibacillus spongiae]|uniref:TetR/AcrR family transcriptional regulator n=1 Tax=Paenibacillus spongiae TaxID=2909671 RepID=A0ABY5SJ09_9BACL|nr:TetR/AcrR family transcriptional regulator [Paenibacillus spongiae]UVI33425.1 TetR/AcrR family transcriptional regulator [Paenibacillus spongiae]
MLEKKETAKDRILRVASDLFYKEGVRAVGIDRIIEESGVAKASFYRNFPTKDSLVVAYLETRHGKRTETIEEAKRRHPYSPKDQLYALLDDLVERLKHPEFRGCPFMNAVVEFPDLEHPGHRAAVNNRHLTWEKVEEIAKAGNVQNPVELTSQIRILCDGAIMSAYIDKDSFQPAYFLSAARRLIEDHFSR